MDPYSPGDGLVDALIFSTDPFSGLSSYPLSFLEALLMNHLWSEGADSLKPTPLPKGCMYPVTSQYGGQRS